MPYAPTGAFSTYYRDLGSAPGVPVLVFLHGSGGDGEVWLEQHSLSHGCRLIIPDLPGHGCSGGEPCCTARDYARWLQAFLTHLQPGPVVLLGHSLGGAIAQWCAAECEGEIRGAVLAGTGARLPVPPDYEQLIARDFAAAVEASCQAAYADSCALGLRTRGRAMLHRNGPDILLADMRVCRDFDSTRWLARLTVPLLVLCGADDAVVPAAGGADLAAQVACGRFQQIPGAGHMLMQEAPGEFNGAVAAFVHRICPEARAGQRAKLFERSDS